jgi:hypothetical protein
MLLGNDRNEHRQIFFTAWHKFLTKQPLDKLEQQLVDIIKRHPEYHKILSNPEVNLDKDYFPEFGETNPFLHMGLHQAVLEQISVDLPKGIRKIYQELVQRFGDDMEAEHCMMYSLIIGMEEAAGDLTAFDNKAYFKRMKKALRDGYWNA